MNADFIQQKIVIHSGAQELAKEYETLVWETDNGKVKEPRKEHSGLPNHLTDAALYLWRHCHQYLYKTPIYEAPWNDQKRWEKAHIEKLAEQIKQEKNPNYLDLDPAGDLFDFSQDDSL